MARLGVDLARAALRRDDEAPTIWSGMTLDADDAALARSWLKRRDEWGDSAPVTGFEGDFAKWNGSRSAFAFSAGRKALSACLDALQLGPDDEVLIPGYTCVVVQNAFDFAGVRAVHCDIELETFGLSLDDIEAKITPRTKAILLQHLFGLVCRDFEKILAFARERGLKVIEDCSHSTGAMFRGKRVGTFGDMGFYSAEWSKAFTTIVGGVAVTDDPHLAERMASFASRCGLPDPDVTEQHLTTLIRAFIRAKRRKDWWAMPLARFTYGSDDTVSTPPSEVAGTMPHDYYTRMPGPLASVGSNQLRKLDGYNELRRRTAERWAHWCDQKGYRKPTVLAGSEPMFLRYPVMVEPELKRDMRWARRELGVDVGGWFVSHLHPSARPVSDCPNADRAVDGCINLPCLLPPGSASARPNGE